MNNKITIQAIGFLVYALLQVILFRNFILFDKAFCFIYIGYLLLLPYDMNRILQMLVGFMMGLFIDIFYDTLGIHAAASVLLMYLRPYWLNVVYGKDQNDSLSTPVLRNLGLQSFSVYVIPVILLHHAALFYIETGGFHMFFFTLAKTLMSTMLTYIMILIFQYLFYPKHRTI
jgi:hypothetical protein